MLNTLRRSTVKLKHAFWHFPGHLIWVVFAYLPFLGRLSVPLTGDQKLYIATAVEMRDHESWLKPLLFGQASYFKPPMQYWATLIGWKIFGFNLLGTLAPSVLCVVLTAWFLGEIATLLGERRWFVNAGLWFAATVGALTYGTTAQMEIYLCAFSAASWWAGLKFLAAPSETRNWKWIYLAFALAGASALIKSPLYSIFWVTGFVTYLLISGEWLLFRQKHLYLANLLGMALGLSWYVTISLMDGQHFWAQYALRENFEKSSGNQGTVISLWWALLYWCFPLTLLVFPSLRAAFRGRRTASVLRFVICWCWPAAVFFSLYPYRIKPYLFILVPALSVLVDWGYFRVGRTKFFRWSVKMTGALMFVLFLLLALVLFRAEIAPIWICEGLIVAGIMALICSQRDWMRGLILSGLASVFLFRAGGICLGEQDLAGLRASVASHPAAAVAMLDEDHGIWHEAGLLSVALEKPIARLQTADELSRFLQAGGLVALSDTQIAQFEPQIVKNLQSQKETRLLIQPWYRWKGRLKFPYKQLIFHGRSGVPDFDQLTHRQFEILSLK